jgi:iron uptake system EfeUOB component EfeO/EfeM
MRGIMGSLRLTYNTLDPNLEQKDPALARQLKAEYDGIMAYIDQADARDRRARDAHSRLSRVELEEMGQHAKAMSDQLAPQIKLAAAEIGVQVPRKPYL